MDNLIIIIILIILIIPLLRLLLVLSIIILLLAPLLPTHLPLSPCPLQHTCMLRASISPAHMHSINWPLLMRYIA